MHISGFTIARNAIRYDYPLLESIRSLLPLVDEMVVAVGDSDDGTLDAVQSVGSEKLRIIETIWDPELRTGGTVLAQQTNLALDACSGDWCFYLQADEVIHENDWDRIQSSLRKNHSKRSIEGLSFRYHHFRADYGIRDPLPYRKQIRIVRSGTGARSVGDACGFGINGRTLKAVRTGAWIYHYGYVKPPEKMAAKLDYFVSLYDNRHVRAKHEFEPDDFQWDLRTCEPFRGTHPSVMAQRIAAKTWSTPNCSMLPRWRNQHFWSGLAHKNTRAIRRWIGKTHAFFALHRASSR